MSSASDVEPPGTSPNLLEDPTVCKQVLQRVEHLALVTVDASDRITGWSPGAASLFGYPDAEALGQPLALLRPDPLRPAWTHRSGTPLKLQVTRTTLQDADGALIVLRDAQGEAAHLLERAERAEATERLFQAVSAATPDHIYLADREGRFLFASHAGASMLGFSPEQMVGRRWQELGLRPDEMAPFDGMREEVQRTGDCRTGETTLSTIYGPRDYEYVLTPVLQGERVLGTVATVRDITERRRAEAALRDSEARFRLAVMHAPLPMAMVAEDGEVLQLNKAWTRLTGYRPEEIATLDAWTERAYGANAAQVRERVARLFDAEGPVDEGELAIRTRDGQTRVWQFSSTPLGRTADGRRTVLSMAVDLTDRRLAEAALRESERRFRVIFETAAIGISVADLQGHPVTANPALQRMLGYTGEELARLSIPDFTHPDDVPVGLDLFRELVAGEREAYKVEKRYVRKDGSVFWGLLTTSLVRHEDSTPQYVVGMVEDISARRDTEEALRESEARFRATFDRAGVGMVLADLEGRFLTTNARFQRFLGYSAEELEGVSFTDITWPEDVQLDWELYTELLQGQRDDYEIEKRYLRRDGAVVWGRLIGTVVRDRAGAVLYGIGMVEDVTARREAEEAQARLVAILEATPDAVGIADVSGHTVYLNRAGKEMLGLQDEDPTGLPLARYHPEWAASLVLREGLPTAAQAGSWHGETALVNQDGQEIPVSQVILAHRGSDGGLRYFSTVIRDISDRMRSEADQRFLLDASRTLSASLELDAVLEALADLVVPERADYCLVDLVEDGGLRRVVARHRDPGQRDLMAQLCHFNDPVSARLGISQVLRSGEPLRVPEVTEPWLRAISQNPDHLRLLQALAPKSEMILPLLAHGQAVGAVTLGSTNPAHHYIAEDLLLAEDLCNRASLALENARLFLDAQRATSVRDEVLRIVAHDLRNPIMAISMATDLLKRKLPEDLKEELRHLQLIRRSADQAQRLIRDLLDVGQMEAGHLSLDLAPQDPAALVEEAVAQLLPLATHRQLDLIAEVAAPLPPVLADRSRIQQVLSNLIGNGVKFTPAGGRITVRASARSDAILFEVEDTGPGVSREDIPRLFEPFWQADHARGSGAGMGLAIVRGIVDHHHGEMRVHSEVGRGTTIGFTLPLASQPDSPG